MNRIFDKLPLIGHIIPGKITLSFLMLLFAINMKFIYNTYDSKICVLAMLLSFIGDVLLNHNKDHNKQSSKSFILGGISFIFAHICYCIAYGYKMIINNFKLINVGFIFAIVILIIITLFIVNKSKSKLLILGILYLWLTGINYSTIFSYAYSVKSIESISALGGLLFLASDVIIGLEKFSGLKSKVARELVWWLYPLWQIILIAMA